MADWIWGQMLMGGQGCPTRWRGYERCRTLGLLLLCSLQICLLTSNAGAAEEIEIRLRITWGGGASRVFAGNITIDRGSLFDAQNLGALPESNASFEQVSTQSIQVFPTSHSSFGGLDLTVRGSPSSKLSFQFDFPAASQSLASQRISTPKSWTIEELVDERQSTSLDAQGNRLVVERAPTDRLRFHFNRPHLIFDSNERFIFDVSGYRTGLPANNYRLSIQLVSCSDNGSPIYQEIHNVSVDPRGDFALVSPNSIKIPERGGVYELQFQVYLRRTLSNLVHPVAVLERKVQFVVMEARSTPDDLTVWQTTDRVDISSTTKSISFPSLGKFSELRWLPTTGKRLTTSEITLSKRVDNVDTLIIPAKEWCTVALNTSQKAKPHRLIVRSPANQSMKLLVSIYGQNGTNDFIPNSLDTGTVIEHSEIDDALNIEEHEILFWPTSEISNILLYNPDDSLPAFVSAIEVRAGPEHLPSLGHQEPLSKKASASSNSIQNDFSKQANRLLALQLNKPISPELFGGMKVPDPETGRFLSDWTTYYDAVNRLAEYCRWNGYNGLVLNVVGEAGFMFPSAVLGSNTQYDSGRFFADGRDPIPKDIVELIARVFDRAGLRLIVAIDFISSVPELEAERHNHSNSASPLEQLNAAQQPWQDRPNGTMQQMTRYNPMDERVQFVAAKMIDELNERYSHHECWNGVALQLGPMSHFNYMGDLWGYDGNTVQQFRQANVYRLPMDFQQSVEAMQGIAHRQFLRWRAQRLAGFYDELGVRVTLQNPKAKLYLLTSRFFEDPPLPEFIQDPYSAARDPNLNLLAHGIDFEQLVSHPNVVVLRGETMQPLESLVRQRWAIETSQDRRLDRSLASGHNSGFQIVQEPQGVNAPTLKTRSPQTQSQAPTWLYPQVHFAKSSTRHQVLRRMATDDSIAWFQGGGTPIWGQESQVTDLMSTYVQLPDIKLQALPASSEKDVNSNIVLRVGQIGAQSYVMIINDSPWAESIQVDWPSMAIGNPNWLSESPSDFAHALVDEHIAWAFTINAYQMIACQISNETAQIPAWSHQANAHTKELLEQYLNMLANRIGEAVEQPFESSNIPNGDFEVAQPNDRKPAGWNVSLLPSATIELDARQPQSGKYCLRIENRSDNRISAWVQSGPLSIPKTGRLAVQLSARMESSANRPQVRIGLIGRTIDGKRFERFQYLNWKSPVDGNVSKLSFPAGELNPGWTDFRIPLMYDIPPEGLVQLQLSIDVEGLGVIWIDDARLCQLFLLDDERSELRDRLFIARDELKNLRYTASMRLLDSYWAKYLDQFEPAKQSTLNNDDMSVLGASQVRSSNGYGPSAAVSPKARTATEESRNWLQKLRDGMRRSWTR